MNWHEMDFRIDPLHDVIIGIEAGLTAIQKRLEEDDGDGIVALEHAEPLLGLGFVAVQTYALGTFCDLNRIRECSGKSIVTKTDCYASDTILVKGKATRIQVINATANYFKHHDEWSQWPTNETTKILASVGIVKNTEFACVEATRLLCGQTLKLIVLHQIVKEWRNHVFSTLK